MEEAAKSHKQDQEPFEPHDMRWIGNSRILCSCKQFALTTPMDEHALHAYRDHLRQAWGT